MTWPHREASPCPVLLPTGRRALVDDCAVLEPMSRSTRVAFRSRPIRQAADTSGRAGPANRVRDPAPAAAGPGHRSNTRTSANGPVRPHSVQRPTAVLTSTQRTSWKGPATKAVAGRREGRTIEMNRAHDFLLDECLLSGGQGADGCRAVGKLPPCVKPAAGITIELSMARRARGDPGRYPCPRSGRPQWWCGRAQKGLEPHWASQAGTPCAYAHQTKS